MHVSGVDTRVNGEPNKSFTCYTISDDTFQNLEDALSYSTTHDCGVEYQYAKLEGGGSSPGLPSSKGGYVIRIRTKETDAYYASEWACIWVVGQEDQTGE